ncbi:SRPBCC domain-containing protein [Pseudoduganella plicata]|uniref:Activator of HSP90 ATPase n=1 Tax=Pseudoduganella plicata TaxID=321984 RepID=A0A4P7BKT5_9BURK|nr:SRPBCC domain-containing protein [Pseudoduganella plicata]QBQ38817.1 SRPBCC domain-containing protein [Pseudoduganella plicata]GGY85329.1 activator of HSP90 ATPase [Pseudoduganella plicata]
MEATATARQTTRPEALRDDELLIVRTFDAPRALVFHIWRQPEHVRQWLAPMDFQCVSLAWDFRPGGAWRACIKSPDSEHWMGGRFIEIEAERHIVFTFRWDPDGSPDTDSPENRITVTFEEEDGRTVQRFHQAPFTTVARRDSHTKGWTSVVERTGVYVERLAREAS